MENSEYLTVDIDHQYDPFRSISRKHDNIFAKVKTTNLC
jgi:hypothetical protein